MSLTTGASMFGERLKDWRSLRKVSQLDLALTAEVSQRHVSWLETGKSKPSRRMVVQLADALDVPLRERNSWLTSAGFAPIYRQSHVDEPDMKPVAEALDLILTHHDPMPAMVLNRRWEVQKTNQAADRLMSLLGPEDEVWERVGGGSERNLVRLTLHPEGLRPLIANWDELLPAFVSRLRRETRAAGSAAEVAELEALLELTGPARIPEPSLDKPLLPILPLRLKSGDIELGLFSVIATFGTPQDVTVDDLRIESFFPMDDQTRSFFENLAC